MTASHAELRGLLPEIGRRRTFAIISHPDAGKTTLTEKLLLFAGAVREAGAVRARRGARATTSDWMEFERRRGISISSTVLQFEYGGAVCNLLDTPGHADFGEDTYRTLCAADTAIMLLDAAKGLEPQTLKLFRVCRARELPLITFVNKLDRPALPALELLDQLTTRLGLVPVPLTWPVGDGHQFAGVVDRQRHEFISVERTPRAATAGAERRYPLATSAPPGVAQDCWITALEELDLLDASADRLDLARFLAGEQTPVFFGSALANVGVRRTLEGLIELAPSPAPFAGEGADRPRPLDAAFSAFVFKIQSNMNPRHRDRVAFLRVCSGSVERGLSTTVARTDRSLQLKFLQRAFGQERATIERAVAGDIVAVANARGLRIGDTLYTGERVSFPPPPSFAPERFVIARNSDLARDKQFRRGIAELAAQGVVQILLHPEIGMREPLLAAVGELQFEVAAFRMAREYGCQIELAPAEWKRACPVDREHTPKLQGRWGIDLLEDARGHPVALFRSERIMEATAEEFPEIRLSRPPSEAGPMDTTSMD
jgi:peptide chain release factor 3